MTKRAAAAAVVVALPAWTGCGPGQPVSSPSSALSDAPLANTAPARPLSDYLGVYASDYWGPAVVTERDGALQLAMGPHNQTFTR